MANRDQKAKEIKILKQFLWLLGVPDYEGDTRQEQQQESPDMIIHLGNKSIGIELTELFTDEHQEYLFHKEGLITALCTELNKQKAPYVGLIVGSINTHFTHICSREFSRTVSTIMQCITQAKNRYKSIPNSGLPIKTGDKRIDSFQFRIIKASRKNEVMKVYAFQTVSNPYVWQKIQACLDVKETKIEHYDPCDEQWLVIYVNSFRPLQYWSDNNQFIKEHKFHSTFNRVFVYDGGDKQIDELRVIQ